MDCLNTIIGISRNGYDCLDIDAGTSLSGLYLDDTNFGRIPLGAGVFDCSNEDFNQFVNRLIPDSVKEVNRLLYMQLERTQVPKYRDTPYKLPRKEDYSKLLPATDGYYYMCIKPRYFAGSIMRIKSLRVPNTTGTIKILDEYGTEYFSDVQTEFEPIYLTLDRDYFIAYQSETRPRNIKYRCRCGSDNLSWKNYVYLGGGTADTLDDLVFREDDYSQGVIIEGIFSCDPFAPLCDLDFENNNWARVYANAVLLTAKKNLAGWLLSSGQITNYITTNGDELPELIGYFNTQLETRIKFMAEMYSLTDCYSCGSITKGSILA